MHYARRLSTSSVSNLDLIGWDKNETREEVCDLGHCASEYYKKVDVEKADMVSGRHKKIR